MELYHYTNAAGQRFPMPEQPLEPGPVISYAQRRLQECDGSYDVRYWAAYLDGARAQQKEDNQN